MKTTLDFIIAGSEVKRYHTVTTLVQETVGHHSHGVAMLCYLLCAAPSADLIYMALVHDLAESQTGDIPSPAKREYGIGEQVHELEARLLFSAGLSVRNLSPAEERVLKLADLAQGALFCVREMSLGNSRMVDVFNRYISYAEGMLLFAKEKALFDLIKEMAQ